MDTVEEQLKKRLKSEKRDVPFRKKKYRSLELDKDIV